MDLTADFDGAWPNAGLTMKTVKAKMQKLAKRLIPIDPPSAPRVTGYFDITGIDQSTTCIIVEDFLGLRPFRSPANKEEFL